MTISWARGFAPPSKEQVEEARGSFPTQHDNALRRTALHHSATTTATLDQINAPTLFQPKQVQPLSPPRDEADWLACNVEEGQTFDEYVDGLSLRSGRFRPHAGMDRRGGIVLVPIVLSHKKWPEDAPSLDDLARFTQAFFHGTPVAVSNTPARIMQEHSKNVKQKRMTWKPPSEYGLAPERWVKVRQSHQRLQVSSESLLTCLTDFTNGKDSQSSKPICVVGVTNIDLFDGEDASLFIAGQTAGRSHVAVLSFFRYHPHLKMSPKDYWKYGYSLKPSSYSYFEPNDEVEIVQQQLHGGKRKRGKTLQLLKDCQLHISEASRRQVLRRATKLLAHELLHIFQVDHCIYHKCLMNGTGHLVEDFAAPPHLCGIDLRKLQYRLGFDVAERYGDLARVYESWKCAKEARWYRQREKEAACVTLPKRASK